MSLVASHTLVPKTPALNTVKFTPPKAEVGQAVLWWAYGETEKAIPLPGIVISVGSRTLHIGVLKPLIRSIDIKDGCRHVMDPEARREEFQESGAWSHTEQSQKLDRLEAIVTEMVLRGTRLGPASRPSELDGLADEELEAIVKSQLSKKAAEVAECPDDDEVER